MTSSHLPPATRIQPPPGIQLRPPLLPPRHDAALTPPRSLFHSSTPPRSSRTAPPTGPAPPLPSHLSQRRVVEAVVRTNPKLRLPRHHSEESLQARGVYGQLGGPNGIYASKIHSSADEISSMNRSEDSSSDESFSRTDFSRTDIESPSPPSRPKNKAPWLYPSDIQIDPSSLESSPKTSQAAGPAFPLLSQPSTEGQHHAGPSGLLRLPTVGQSPSPAHHDEFRSEVESELEFEEQGLLPGDEGGGAGEQLATRLELPHGVTGVESCRSAMSSPMESYIGDSCGSFEFLPKESPLRRVLRATTTEDKDTPPRDIKKEIERRAMEIEEQREADNKAANKDNKANRDNKAEAEADESNRSNGSREGRRSSGSDRRSSGGQSGSEGRRRRNRKVSATEASDPLPGTKEEGELPRQVNNQVLVEMARDIRPPPLEPSEVRSPRGAKGRAGRGQKESTAAFGPMPNFEREVQRIIAEQEIVSKVASDAEKPEPPSSQQQQQGGSPAKRKEELVEKLARLNSRYVAPAGAEKPEAAGKVGLAAVRDLAAAQEAALLGKPQPSLGEDEVTPTNDLHLLRLDPSSNRMTLELGQDGRRPPGRFPLELPASPLSPLRSPLSRVESTRSRGSGKGKESEYENGESDCPDEEEIGIKRGLLNMSRDSEQRETDEFEEAERRMLAEEAKAGSLHADEHVGVLSGEHGHDHAAPS